MPVVTPICLIEAASNGDSEDQSATNGFKKRIQPILFENGFMNVLAGGFARVLNEEEVEMFAQSLKAAVEKLETSPNQLICVEGAYKLVVSKDCGDSSHEKVCEANGIKPRTLAYPPFDPREEVRTLRKLKKELLHFPIGSPALIVIEASPLMVLIQDKRQRFVSLRDALRTWMEAQENLFAIVVTLRCLAPQPRNVVLDNWDILIEQSLGMTALDHVILFNPSYEREDKDNLIKLVTEAFLKDYCSTPLPGR